MLTEQRKIIFPDIELADAIRQHDKATDRKLPDREITSISVTAVPEPSVLIKFQNGNKNDLHSIVFDQAFLVAAMLRYCIDQKVMIPKQAKKWIEVKDQTLSLVCFIDEHVVEAPDSSYYVLL